MATTWIVRRARFYAPGHASYIVRRGTPEPQPTPKSYDALTDMAYVADNDDGTEVDVGTAPWPDCDCPDCGAVLVWAEAGFMPGHRICPRCGGHWEVTTRASLPSITTASGYEVTDPKSPLLTATEAGRLVARQGRTLDAGASRAMVEGYYDERAAMSVLGEGAP